MDQVNVRHFKAKTYLCGHMVSLALCIPGSALCMSYRKRAVCKEFFCLAAEKAQCHPFAVPCSRVAAYEAVD